jgi:hypothetical protein
LVVLHEKRGRAEDKKTATRSTLFCVTSFSASIKNKTGALSLSLLSLFLPFLGLAEYILRARAAPLSLSLSLVLSSALQKRPSFIRMIVLASMNVRRAYEGFIHIGEGWRCLPGSLPLSTWQAYAYFIIALSLCGAESLSCLLLFVLRPAMRPWIFKQPPPPACLLPLLLLDGALWIWLFMFQNTITRHSVTFHLKRHISSLSLSRSQPPPPTTHLLFSFEQRILELKFAMGTATAAFSSRTCHVENYYE